MPMNNNRVHSAMKQRRDGLSCLDAPADPFPAVPSALSRPNRDSRTSRSCRIASSRILPPNTAMGAENSKPSSEVKQHVFAPYVPLLRANGSYAQR